MFVPEFQAAFFGGDPDNFNFPRFNIDMALVRVYENDQPVKPEHYFKWSTAGAKEGKLVFVTGHPGSTSRLNTVAHLEQLRDTSIPIIIRLLERREGDAQEIHGAGRRANAPGAKRTQQRSEQFEGLSRTTCGTERHCVDGPQDERRAGAAQIDRGESGTAEDVRRRVGRDCQST